ncbi:Peroxisomal membrane protein PMP27 [Entomortierella beljakovae]|nr:Peroxisomal membrane protein PMP27 [Entomortierella beljakovae]
MSQYHWKNPHRIHMLAINSWKQSLSDYDENSARSTIKNQIEDKTLVYQGGGANSIVPGLEESIKSRAALLTEINCCRQIRAFPTRPEITDLIPRNDIADQEFQAETISLPLLRKLKKQKLSRISNASLDQGQQDQGYQLEKDATHSNVELESDSSREYTDVIKVNVAVYSKLEAAIESLREKLEILQPEGSRPSDIAAKLVHSSLLPKIGGSSTTTEELRNPAGNMENEMVLSQDVASQRSIFIWDEIRTIIESSISSTVDLRTLAEKSISELGIENLEDGVLHRLCTNEIFTSDRRDEEKHSIDVESAMSDESEVSPFPYQIIQPLCRVLFCQKALGIKSTPSRLFLDAVLHAGKRHGRAVVDNVLLPLLHDRVGFSKLTSELIQKVMKEQSSASMVHFLSCAFEPVAIGELANGSTILNSLPVLFYSEIYLATIQTLLGYNNVPAPLPTRLWARLNVILNILWEKVSSVVISITSSATSNQIISRVGINSLKDAIDTKNEITWILRMFCPPQVIDVLVQSAGSGRIHDENMTTSGIDYLNQTKHVRLSSSKLVQLLMIWTMRQGPKMSTAVINVKPWLNFAATTVGRDKLYRGVQYFSRFLAWYLYRMGSTKETVQRFDNLKKALALSRKLMRIGKPIEHVESAVKATSIKDEVSRSLTIGKQLSYAGYLTFDALLFFDGSGAYKFKNIKRYGELANKFWLAGIIFGFLTGLYKTRQIQIRQGRLENHSKGESSSVRSDLKILSREQHEVNKQLVQDALDMFIPATGLGYVNLDDGAVGLIGTITSIMGGQAQWEKYILKDTLRVSGCNNPTVEVLNSDIPYGRTESRTPTTRTRRKTGESVNRPNNGQGKPSSSAPSTPRPIPKSNKKTLQPSSMSSSYTFDDSTDNPFLPSTPPAFTPSMERTGFTKPDSSKPDSSKPVSSSFTEAPKNTPAARPITPNTPPIMEEKPSNFSFARSRDGSVSSMSGMAKPRHEDMILPAVARRIKEQGLLEHDVVAYSDDYHAPLYKIPTSSSHVNNPFAGYDRAKAASSASLGQTKSPLSTPKADTNTDQRPQTASPILSPSPIIPDTQSSPSRSERSNKKQDVNTVPENQTEQQTPPTDTTPKTPQATTPERPRRTRRNTNRETQQDHAVQIDEPRPQRQRRPTLPENLDYNYNASNTKQYVDTSSPKQYYDQESSLKQDKRSGRRDQLQQNTTMDHYNTHEEYRMHEMSNSGYDHRQDDFSQMGNGNRRYEPQTQEQGQYRNDNHHLNDRNDHHNHHGGNDYNWTDGNTQSNQAHQYNSSRYGARPGHNNTQQYNNNAQEAGYNSRSEGQQAGFNPQKNNYYSQQGGSNTQAGHNNSYGSEYNNQKNHESQNGAINPPNSYYNGFNDDSSRPEAVHVNMPDAVSGAKVDANDHKDNSKKKKGVCCVIM